MPVCERRGQRRVTKTLADTMRGALLAATLGLAVPALHAAPAVAQATPEENPLVQRGVPAEATAETGAFAVVGVIERDGATLYCTVLYFDGAKGLVGKHRKLMPTAGERLVWGFGDGSTMPVFKTDYGTIGAVICWENYMPALRMHMYHQGVSLYCAPTADDRDTWLATMQHIALEGRTFVLTACQHITRAAYGPDHESALGDDPATVMMRGGSAIIGPLGKVLAGPNFSGETILYAEIDPAEIPRAKYDFDVTGHYARPDVFELTVDTRAKSAVKEV